MPCDGQGAEIWGLGKWVGQQETEGDSSGRQGEAEGEALASDSNRLVVQWEKIPRKQV